MSDTENRHIAKNSIYLFIRLLFSVIIGLYSSRVLLNELGVNEYGLYYLIGGFVSMLTILTGTLNCTATRFITYEIGFGDIQKLENTVGSIISIMLIAAILIFIIASIIGPWIINRYLNIPLENLIDAYFIFYCSVATFCFNIYSVPYQALVMAYEKMNFFAYMSILESVAKLVLVIGLIYIPFDKLYSYAIGIVFISISIRIIYGIYCSRIMPESRFHIVFNKKIIKEMSFFSFWVGIGTAFGILKDEGISIIINIFFGLTLNAARGISVQINSLLNSLAQNIGFAVAPQITKSYSQGNLHRSIQLTFMSAKIQGYLILFIAIPFLLESEYILTLWLENLPPYTNEFVRWTILIGFIHTICNTHSSIFLAIGRVRNLQLISVFVNVGYLMGCYISCRNGASPIICMQFMLITEILLLFICYTFLKFYVDFPILKFFVNVIIPMILSGIIVYLLSFEIKSMFSFSAITELITITLCSTTLLFGLIYCFGLNVKERKFISNFILNKFNR